MESGEQGAKERSEQENNDMSVRDAAMREDESNLTCVRQDVLFEGGPAGELLGAMDAQEDGESGPCPLVARPALLWLAIFPFFRVLEALSLVIL